MTPETETPRSLAVIAGSGSSRSPYTPAVGSQVRFSTCGTIATVTGHTARGFTYKDGPVLSIPRMGILGTGEGECYTDIPGWDTYVIRFKSEVSASCPNIRGVADGRSSEPESNP